MGPAASVQIKEVALIHGKGVLEGEMKHGTLVLVDETMPIEVVATHGSCYRGVRPAQVYTHRCSLSPTHLLTSLALVLSIKAENARACAQASGLSGSTSCGPRSVRDAVLNRTST